MWFELIISARTFYMASLPEKDAEEDHGDVGLTISSNGQAYPLQSVFSMQRTLDRSAWRALVSVSVTSDPQSSGWTWQGNTWLCVLALLYTFVAVGAFLRHSQSEHSHLLLCSEREYSNPKKRKNNFLVTRMLINYNSLTAATYENFRLSIMVVFRIKIVCKLYN